MTMEAEQSARRLIDDYASNAARRSGLPDADRTEARQELVSHVYEIAASQAQAAGAERIEHEHARQAIRAVGNPDDVDAAFFAPRRAELERAPFLPRAVAYGVDLLLIHLVFNALMGPLLFLSGPLFSPWSRSGAFECDFTPFGPDCYASGGELFWGPTFVAFGLVYLIGIVVAFAAFEVMMGQTPGKMLLKLRATDEHGGPVSWRQGILRNLTKIWPVLVLIDAVAGEIRDGSAKERISDRVAGTAVVREVD